MESIRRIMVAIDFYLWYRFRKAGWSRKRRNKGCMRPGGYPERRAPVELGLPGTYLPDWPRLR